MLSNLFGWGKKKSSQGGVAGDAGGSAAGGAAARPQPIDVTDADFDARVVASPHLAVVDFWAEWCAPCTTMSAYVTFLAAEYGAAPQRLTVAALDVDENPVTSERYGVLGLPTLLFLHRGVEVQRIVGLEPYEDIKREVERLLAAYPA
jgi:thioredoxin 1